MKRTIKIAVCPKCLNYYELDDTDLVRKDGVVMSRVSNEYIPQKSCCGIYIRVKEFVEK